jgi:hypothetical protein
MNTQMVRLFAISLSLLAVTAYAQDAPAPPIEALELTIELMPEGATQPDAVTRIIELPAAVAEAARENSVRGLAEANAARDNRNAGLENAEEARERGRDQAQQDRENAGRGRPEDLPGGPPGGGGPPSDPPGPPGN